MLPMFFNYVGLMFELRYITQIGTNIFLKIVKKYLINLFPNLKLVFLLLLYTHPYTVLYNI